MLPNLYRSDTLQVDSNSISFTTAFKIQKDTWLQVLCMQFMQRAAVLLLKINVKL